MTQLKLSGNAFKKWQVIKISSTGKTQLITDIHINKGEYSFTITTHPFNPSKYKLINRIKVSWIKLKYFFKSN